MLPYKNLNRAAIINYLLAHIKLFPAIIANSILGFRGKKWKLFVLILICSWFWLQKLKIQRNFQEKGLTDKDGSWTFESLHPNPFPFSFVKVYLSHFRKNICHHPMWYFATVDETWINCLFLCNLSGTHFLCHLRNLCWGWGGRRGLHSLKLLEPPLP